MPLELKINGSYVLPTHIKTQRLLFGGGLAIVGTTDYEEQLPFSLRSRILFDDSAGELVFRGYYDGASPEYIKGDPLLLLNVMSQSDKMRLRRLCETSTGATAQRRGQGAVRHLPGGGGGAVRSDAQPAAGRPVPRCVLAGSPPTILSRRPTRRP